MAREFTELIAWQLARELKLRVYELVMRPKVALDRAFVAQIADAAASAPRNIAEGFGRFNRREFAQFLKTPIASEQEVRNHFLDAYDRDYVSATERDEAVQLSRRAVTAATRLESLPVIVEKPFRLDRSGPEPQEPQNLRTPEPYPRTFTHLP